MEGGASLPRVVRQSLWNTAHIVSSAKQILSSSLWAWLKVWKGQEGRFSSCSLHSLNTDGDYIHQPWHAELPHGWYLQTTPLLSDALEVRTWNQGVGTCVPAGGSMGQSLSWHCCLLEATSWLWSMALASLQSQQRSVSIPPSDSECPVISWSLSCNPEVSPIYDL